MTAAIFAAALAVLRHSLAELRWSAVTAHLQGMSLPAVLGSVLCTVASYGMLTLYDYFATRAIGRPLSWRQVAPVAFMAFGVSHSVGLSSLSAASIRYRNYAQLGYGALEIAGIVGMCTLTFMLGVGTLLGASLLLQPQHAEQVLHWTPLKIHGLGAAFLLFIGGYVLLTALHRRPLRLFRREMSLPRPQLVLAQLGTGAIDLCLASGSLYVLLHDAIGIGYPAFIGIYVLAIQAGVLSNVPGGVGVFESVLLLLLPGVDNAAVVGGVLLYRLIYYLVPFVLALLLLAVREALAGRHWLRHASGLVRRWLELLAPRVLAVAVFAAGIVLLISGATPEIDERMEFLRGMVPLPVLEFSHIAGSAIGVALLILARGLYQRLDAAWWLTMALLGGGIAASLLKGFDYEEASLLGVLLLLLAASSGRFYRRAPLLEQPFSRIWIIGILLAVGLAVWLAVISYSDVPYERDLLWQFAFDDDAPRVLRAGLLSVLIAAAYALWTLLSPSHPELAPPTDEELAQAAAIIAQSPDTLANLALLGDKKLLFADSGDAFLMFQRSGRSMIAMGDPIGNPKSFTELVWKFRELCDRSARWPVFYQITADYLPLYLDLGLALAKLGEEARVYLPDFSLEGRKRADLRNEHRRAGREGVRFAVLSPSEAEARFAELQDVSDQWLMAKATAEKGFSVGRFDAAYIRHFAHACVLKDDRIVAFATLWQAPAREELSIDLMRYGEAAPRGVMDYLFVELMLWGKQAGYRWFNIGMAPLSGLEGHPLSPFWHKLGSLVRRYGNNFYNFEGLRRYKEKFSPEWRPRYLASPGGLTLPRVALDAAALIAGGLREVVSK